MSTPASARPIIAILSVSYGSASEIASMLRSVRRATQHPTLLTVADNLPTAVGTEDAVVRAGGRYTPLPDNPGYGGAINALVRKLPPSVEWIMVTNPDVLFHDHAIDLMLEAGIADDRIGAIGPMILNDDGTLYPSARSVPSLRTGVGHALFSGIWPSNPWTRRYHSSQATDQARDAGWLSGSCVLVRRTAFEDIAGFDEDFFMYFEDVDLGYRLGRAGWRNRYVPAAQVTHSGGHSTTTESSAMIRAHHRSAARFVEKKYPGRAYWPLRAPLLIGLRMRSRLAERRARSSRAD
ncbi:dTDP-Rha--alpha-D-GlcNAc-pyrophosphate polyprenol alpha-3-L-rhamnosyltransferase [Agromyces badenianii]|uniref:dTDP-Rha--alpha-D-GlcNAc-pyrophosphate polyprenol alpha-3-L-rhamnosyltransferase n=1 Tax=Agromyces badenianii TaxID=2080742 RepID=A0A2S0WX44_9MICO|nr:glycosyltransferase family 2 protein [Agromyces badenianii]AWB95917.1 dTDP-Rha--alpha-D-GlcNAc-pyrophosphate polyprenol alpha-3-L-rhamnosyltransferase [Agromyces badenianii]